MNFEDKARSWSVQDGLPRLELKDVVYYEKWERKEDEFRLECNPGFNDQSQILTTLKLFRSIFFCWARGAESI